MTGKKLLFLAFTALILPNINAAEDSGEENFAVELTVDNFDEAIAKNNHFVKFFAPWDGHSKRLNPIWEQLAKKMNFNDKTEVIIANVDCTQQEPLCNGIGAYPTLRFFKVGENETVTFSGEKNISSLTEFIDEALKADSKFFYPVIVKGESVKLSQPNFSNYIANGKHFVYLHLSWREECKRFAPTWKELAETLGNETALNIADIDCSKHGNCNGFEIKTYPAFFWFENGKKIEEYSGLRSHDDMYAYVKKMLKSDNNQSKLRVIQLTNENFESLIGNDVTFVNFYSPSCIKCQKLSPIWDQLAEKIHSSARNIRIAKIDCTFPENKKLCSEQKVEEGDYPSLIIYKNGKRQAEYGQSLPHFVQYIRQFLGRDEL